MDMNYLITHAKKRIAEFPHLKTEILDIVELAENEIEEGGSPTHEVQLAFNNIEEIVGNS